MGDTLNVQIQKVKKRDGSEVDFDVKKIENAIKAAVATTGHDYANIVAFGVAKKVLERLSLESTVTVEQVQDAVELELMRAKMFDVAKAYITYRHDRENVRLEKKRLLNKVELDSVDKTFNVNQLRVLAERYLLRNGQGEIIESVRELFERVAILVSIPEILYDSQFYDKDGGYTIAQEDDGSNITALHIGKYKLNQYHAERLFQLYNTLDGQGKMRVSIYSLFDRWHVFEDVIRKNYELMVSCHFLPNTPTLMNAGTRLGQLSACFVLPMEDNIESIMKAAADAALIFKSGGGVGISYSKLRPKGSTVFSTHGVASGPCSFMRIIDVLTDVIKQGGKRRGANMGIVNWDHPDIEEFVTMKNTPGVMENFNVSVGMDDMFWNHYFSNLPEERNLLNMIANSAWKSAEPGVIFFDNINKHNPLKREFGPLEVTNPCGEQALYANESCNLGSIDLSKFIFEDSFDYSGFAETVNQCTRLLDNVIDANKYPTREIHNMTHRTRRIGLGIMGLGDLLYAMKLPYNSKEAYNVMNEIASSLALHSRTTSIELAEERGSYPAFSPEDWDDNIEGMRNSFQTTIAPTGSLSMIADTSNGVEPCFSLAFEKRISFGSFWYKNKVFEQDLRDRGLYSEELLKKIADNHGSVQGLDDIPDEMQRIYVTAMDLHWMDHIVAQAIWQKWINNAIAKTINMPEDATVEDVKMAYALAHELGLKGVTVYRDNSRHAQVCYASGAKKPHEVKPSQATLDYIRQHLADSPLFKELFPDSVVKETAIYGDTSRPHTPILLKKGDSITDILPGHPAEPDLESPCCEHPIPVINSGCVSCANCGFSICHVA